MDSFMLYFLSAIPMKKNFFSRVIYKAPRCSGTIVLLSAERAVEKNSIAIDKVRLNTYNVTLLASERTHLVFEN
jgi:hypothetical protein